MFFRFLTGILLFTLTTALTAQTPDPIQVSDFTGNQRQPLINGIHSLDNELYATFGRSFNDVAGIISRIDLSAGSVTPLVDAQTSGLYSFNSFTRDPLMLLEEKLLGVYRNEDYGTFLSRFDGDSEEVLFYTSFTEISTPVAAGDKAYFVATTGPAELAVYETDGTRAGTREVFSQIGIDFASDIKIVPGDRSVMIDLSNRFNREVLYIRREGTTTVGSEIDAVSNFLGVIPFNQQKLLYRNGAFYLAGETQSDGSFRIFRVDDATGTVSEVPLRSADGNAPYSSSLDDLELFVVNDQLHALGAMGSSAQFFSILTETAQPTARLLPPEGNGLNFDLLPNGTWDTTDDSFIYLASEEFNTQVLEFTPLDNTIRLVATVDQIFSSFTPITLEETDGYVYISHPFEDVTYQVNLADGTTNVNDKGVDLISYNFQVPTSAFTLYREGVLYLAEVTDEPALYYWRNGSEQPEPVGDFLSGSSTYQQLLTSASDVPPVVQRSSELVAYYYDAEEMEVISTPLPDGANGLSIVLSLENKAYFRATNLTTRPILYELLSGTLVPAVLDVEGAFDPNAYKLGFDNFTSFEGGPQVVFIDPLGNGAISPYLPSFENGTLHLDLIDALENGGPNANLVALDSTYLVISDGTSTRTVTAYDFDQNELYSFEKETTFGDTWLAATDSEAWVFEPITRQEAIIRYFSADGDQRTYLIPSTGRLLDRRNAVKVMGNSLLVAFQRFDTGREYYLLEPSAGSPQLVYDINPGQMSSLSDQRGANTPVGRIFPANDGSSGAELWFTDATEAGTRMLADINPGTGYANPLLLNTRPLAGWIYLSATGPFGRELYRVNAESLEVELVADVAPGVADSDPSHLSMFNGDLFFMAHSNDTTARQLFRLPGILVSTDEPGLKGSPATVFPNPVAKGPLRVEAPAGEQLQLLELYDQLGRLVLTQEVQGMAGAEMLLANFPAGKYWLRARYASGRIGITGVANAGR